MVSAWPLFRLSRYLFTGRAAKNAATSESGIAIQKRGLTSVAFIAPGITAITILSTTSIVAIESVSAANTTERAAKKATPVRSNGSVDKLNPNTKANAIEIRIVKPLPSPSAVPSTKPVTSPIAQPVKQ